MSFKGKCIAQKFQSKNLLTCGVVDLRSSNTLRLESEYVNAKNRAMHSCSEFHVKSPKKCAVSICSKLCTKSPKNRAVHSSCSEFHAKSPKNPSMNGP